jgi:glucodextranase-like protein
VRRALVLAVLAACDSATEMPAPSEITLAITSPSPGDEIVGSEHPTITVSGTVSTTADASTLEAWVNGAQVEIVNGMFTTEITPEPGINHIKVEGGDSRTPLVSQQLDVVWAPDYLPPRTGETGFDVTGAIDLRLGQGFFDGRLFGSTLDLTTDPVVAHDLGAALELILHHVELAKLLPSHLTFGGGNAALDVAITSANPAQILVDAKIVDTPSGALALSIDLNGVFLAMNGTFTFGTRTLIVDGGIAADMHATARLALGMAQDGSIAVTVSNVTAVVGPLVPSFVGPNGDELDAFIQIGNSDFRTVIEGLIQQQLIPTFTDKVPPILEQLLGAADKLLDGVSFSLDSGLGTAVTVNLDSSIGSLVVVAGPAVGTTPGHVTVHEDVAIRPTAAPIHASSRGAPRLDPSTPQPILVNADVQLALRQELLNALLHSLWNSGFLEGNASFGGLSAKVSAKLSPVVRPTPPSSPCTINDIRCDVLLQLGQLEVALPDFEQTFAINATAGARIVIDGTKVSIAVQDTPELIVWETSAVPGRLSPDAVRDVVTRVVWPMLFGAISQKLSITLPLPDIASLGLGDIAPGLANAQLVLQTGQRPDVTPGYITLGAELALSTPPPP